jgi:hypothetical protein
MNYHNTCLDCGAANDTIFHALTQCSFAKLFWSAFKDLCHIKLPNLHPVTWTTDLLNSYFCPTAEATATNGRRHGSVPLELSSACRWARDTANDLVLSTKKPTGCQAQPKRSHWVPPPSKSIKINSDAAFDANTFSGSTGYVIRDDKGLFIAAGAKWYGAWVMHSRLKLSPVGMA